MHVSERSSETLFCESALCSRWPQWTTTQFKMTRTWTSLRRVVQQMGKFFVFFKQQHQNKKKVQRHKWQFWTWLLWTRSYYGLLEIHLKSKIATWGWKEQIVWQICVKPKRYIEMPLGYGRKYTEAAFRQITSCLFRLPIFFINKQRQINQTCKNWISRS